MLNKITFLLLFLFSLVCVAANRVMEIIPLHNRPASEIQPVIVPFLDASDSVIPSGFNLIIKTTPAKLREIKVLIKQLDSALNNLKVTVIQSKNINAEQLNAGTDVSINIPLNKLWNTQGQINAHYQQKQHQHSHYNKQVLRTLEGIPAYIKVGSNYPVQSTQIYDLGYNQHTITRQTQLIEATTGFAVLPRLNGDQVMLEISPWSDKIQYSGKIEAQGMKTTIRTRLGEWVEIATVNEQQQTENTGLLLYQQSNSAKIIRILVKVEKTN